MMRPFDVRLQVTFLCEVALAVRTLVWLLAAVLLQVYLERVLLIEGSITQRTGIRPLSCKRQWLIS